MTFGLRQKPFGVSRQSAGRPAGVGKNVLAWLWVVTVLACSSSDGHGSAAMDAGTAPACDSTCLGTCVGDRCEIQIFSDADRMHPSPYFIAVNGDGRVLDHDVQYAGVRHESAAWRRAASTTARSRRTKLTGVEFGELP